MILRVRSSRSVRSWMDEYVVCPRTPVAIDELTARAKVRPGTYADGLVRDLYAAIFRRSLDLKADYAMYFAIEYPTFADYLRRRCRFTPPSVARLTAELPNSVHMFHFHPAYSFLDEAYGLKFLNRLLGADAPDEVSDLDTEDDQEGDDSEEA